MITPLQAFSNLLPLFVAGEAANNLVNETFSISAWSEMFGNNYTVQEGTISCQQFFSLREGFKSAYLDRDQLILITNVTKGEGDGQRKSYSNDQEVYFKTCQIGGQKVTILPCNPQSGSETLKMVFMHGIEQEEKVLQSYYSIEKGNETQWGKILRMGWSELVKAVNDLKKEKFPLEASAESSHAAQSGLESATAAKLVEAEAKVEELRANGAQIEKEKKSLKESIASLQEGLLTESGAKKVLQRQVQKKDTALNDLQSQYDQAFSTIAKLNEELSDLEAKASGLEKNMTTLKSLCNHTQLIVTEEGSNLTEEIDIFQSTLEEKEMTKIAESGALVKASVAELDGKNAIVKSLESNNADLEDKVGLLQASMDELTRVLGEKESSLGEAEATIAALRQESLSSKAVNDLKKEKEALEASVEYLSGLESATAAKLEEKDTALNDLQSQYDKAVSTIAKLNEEKSVLEAKASSLEKNITTLKSLRNDNTQLITTEEGSSSSLEGSFELHDLYTCVRNCSYHLFPFTDMEIWAMITWALGVTSFLCVLIVNFGLGFGLM